MRGLEQTKRVNVNNKRGRAPFLLECESSQSVQCFVQHCKIGGFDQDLIPELVLQSRDGRFRGAKHLYALGRWQQPVFDFSAHPQSIFLLLAANEKIRERTEWRVPHQLAKLKFFLVERLEILRGGHAD